MYEVNKLLGYEGSIVYEALSNRSIYTAFGGAWKEVHGVMEARDSGETPCLRSISARTIIYIVSFCFDGITI